MADFQFYLNRQGIRGLQGVKGDQGDSPIITVQTETPNEYILKITNPDGTELISPNLRGNKININEGTYVRYNTETGELYTSSADGATGELAGVVRLATDTDITGMDERAAVTPSQLADALSKYLVSPDGSVKIVQNAENSLTELTAEKGLTELPIASADTLGGVKIGENLSISEDGTLTANDGNYIKTSQVSTGGLSYGVYLNKYNGNKLDTIQPKFNTFDGALETLSIQYLNAATYSASEPADEDMVNNWTDKNGFFTGSTTPTGFISGEVRFGAGSGSVPVVFKLMEAGLISGIDQKGRSKFSKIEISTDGTTYTEYNNNITRVKYIRFTFDYNFTDIAIASFSTRIKILASNIAGGNTKALSVKVDNQTIQIVDDKLHVNFDEINGEVSALSGRVNVVEADILKKQNKLVQGDNITLTNNEDGTTTIAAESTVPTNMVTTDTDQTITSPKTFTRGITTTDIYPSGTINFSGTSGAINSCKQIAGGYGAGSYIDLSDMMDISGRNSLTLKGGTGGLKLTAASSSSITCENDLIAPNIRTTANGTIKLAHPMNNASGLITLSNDYGQLSISSSLGGNNNLLGVVRGTAYALINGDNITTRDKDGNERIYINTGNLVGSDNITISSPTNIVAAKIDISQALLNRITILETTVASLQTQIGEISAQLDAINGEVI